MEGGDVTHSFRIYTYGWWRGKYSGCKIKWIDIWHLCDSIKNKINSLLNINYNWTKIKIERWNKEKKIKHKTKLKHLFNEKVDKNYLLNKNKSIRLKAKSISK